MRMGTHDGIHTVSVKKSNMKLDDLASAYDKSMLWRLLILQKISISLRHGMWIADESFSLSPEGYLQQISLLLENSFIFCG